MTIWIAGATSTGGAGALIIRKFYRNKYATAPVISKTRRVKNEQS
jgi:hypothetical protein